MKRPVFWAVVMFALGEVAGLFVRTWKQLGIASAMLICVAGIAIFRGHKIISKRSSLAARLLTIFLPLGCVFSTLRSGNYHYFDYARQIDAKAGCAMALVMPEQTATVSVIGKVQNISKGEAYTNVTLQIRTFEITDAAMQNEYIGPRILVSIQTGGDAVSIGDLLHVRGLLTMISPADNPGQFDMQKYYLARKIRYQLKAEYTEIVGRNVSAKRGIMEAREHLKACIYNCADDETAALYSGMLLGDKTGISKDMRRLFECAGISHILSISALHISLVAMTIYKLLRRWGIHFVVACPSAGLLVFLYGTLTGWSFSAVRAAIMLGLVFLGELLGRKVDLLTSASIALLAMSLTNPYLLFDSGVCIGFAAVIGIAIGQKYNRIFQAYYKKKQKQKPQGSHTSKRKKELKQKYCAKLMGAFIIGTSIYVITAPVLARVYYSVSTYTILVNLIIVPLTTVVIIMGLVGLLLACVHLPFAGIFFWLGGRVLDLFVVICRIVVRLPMATITTGKITIFEAALYYIFVVIAICFSTKGFRRRCCKLYHKWTYKWVDKRMWRRILLSIYVIYFSCAGVILVQIRRTYLKEEIIVLSVGQGDGILLRTEGGCNIVIDGGSTSKDTLGENILMPAIKSQRMHHIHYWMISHADQDHVSGLEDILDMGIASQIKIDSIVVADAAIGDKNTQNIIRKARENNINVIYMKRGDRLVGNEDFVITCVGPGDNRAMDNEENRNDSSLCFVYESKRLFALFTGDAGAEELDGISQYMQGKNWSYKNKKTVLKVPHHGSKNSCIDDLYGHFDLAVISCGRNNLYGHPHDEMLELLRYEGCEIMRTDVLGAITIR